jgi:hypothetical protein
MKIETVSVSIFANAVCLEAITLFFVINPLLVLMLALKTNCLLITGDMFSHIPCSHAHAIGVAQKIINLVVQVGLS